MPRGIYLRGGADAVVLQKLLSGVGDATCDVGAFDAKVPVPFAPGPVAEDLRGHHHEGTPRLGGVACVGGHPEPRARALLPHPKHIWEG